MAIIRMLDKEFSVGDVAITKQAVSITELGELKTKRTQRITIPLTDKTIPYVGDLAEITTKDNPAYGVIKADVITNGETVIRQGLSKVSMNPKGLQVIVYGAEKVFKDSLDGLMLSDIDTDSYKFWHNFTNFEALIGNDYDEGWTYVLLDNGECQNPSWGNGSFWYLQEGIPMAMYLGRIIKHIIEEAGYEIDTTDDYFGTTEKEDKLMMPRKQMAYWDNDERDDYIEDIIETEVSRDWPTDAKYTVEDTVSGVAQPTTLWVACPYAHITDAVGLYTGAIETDAFYRYDLATLNTDLVYGTLAGLKIEVNGVSVWTGSIGSTKELYLYEGDEVRIYVGFNYEETSTEVWKVRHLISSILFGMDYTTAGSPVRDLTKLQKVDFSTMLPEMLQGDLISALCKRNSLYYTVTENKLSFHYLNKATIVSGAKDWKLQLTSVDSVAYEITKYSKKNWWKHLYREGEEQEAGDGYLEQGNETSLGEKVVYTSPFTYCEEVTLLDASIPTSLSRDTFRMVLTELDGSYPTTLLSDPAIVVCKTKDGNGMEAYVQYWNDLTGTYDTSTVYDYDWKYASMEGEDWTAILEAKYDLVNSMLEAPLTIKGKAVVPFEDFLAYNGVQGIYLETPNGNYFLETISNYLPDKAVAINLIKIN